MIKSSINWQNNTYYTLIYTVCGIPPEIGNGSYSGPSKAISGSIYNYSCNEGFVAFGEFKNNLQVECLSNGSFSLDGDRLPVCLRGKKSENYDKKCNISIMTNILNPLLYSIYF